MRVVILGAGVTGVTAAYVLASRGHEVEVVDQEDGPAMQTSYSNGSQLSYSHAQPWANPAVLTKALAWVLRSDAPLVLRPQADVGMLTWLARFLRNCTPARAAQNCERMMRIGLYSREKLAHIREETGIDFAFADTGILHVFSDNRSYQAAIKQAEFQESLGCKEDVLTTAQCLEKEPALAHTQKNIVGGIFSPLDQSGDIYQFTCNLARYCSTKLGVRFTYGTTILKLNTRGDSLASVTTSSGDMQADTFVMALGAYSPLLLRPVGVRIPIYPMKGYSITVPAWDGAPTVSITDDEQKVVFSRIGDRIRSAGTAEFAGYNTAIRPQRIMQITNTLQQLFPSASLENMEQWACVRPQTPDGPPIIGRTRYDNLFLNTGHGTLGWTQSHGSAYLLADMMEGRPTEISRAGLDMSRYRK